MKECIKRFFEKHSTTLEENNIELILQRACVQLSRTDVNILCSYLDEAEISYEQYIPAVVEELVKNNAGLRHSYKMRLSAVVDTIPYFNYKDPILFRNIVADAIRRAYPNKTILTDRYGIEFVMENI